MAKIIEISEDEVYGLSEKCEKVLKAAGKMMQCIEDMLEEGPSMGERRGGMRGGYRNGGGSMGMRDNDEESMGGYRRSYSRY